MKKITLALIMTVLLQPLSVLAMPNMMLVGDSWAVLMCVNQSFQKAFFEEKISAHVVGCHATSSIGLRAENWFTEKERKRTESMLKLRTDIDVVYLSLGGNDFLNRWNKSMSQSEEMALLLDIREKMLKVAKSFTDINPKVKVLVSGYDYARFSESENIPTYHNIFVKTGEPTTVEMHKAILRFAEVMSTLADNKRIFYIHHHGLMHYLLGQQEDGLAPRVSTPPEQISPPYNPKAYGGFPEMELDRRAMIWVGKFVDSYHLAPESYKFIAKHSIMHYLRRWLTNPQR